MAAALRLAWTLDRGICDCVADGGGVSSAGGEVRWGCDTVRFASCRLITPQCVSCTVRAARRRRGAGICCARLDYSGSGGRDDDEDASTLVEMTALVGDLFHLNQALKNEPSRSGIGADVCSRVDVLYNRATLLKFSADSMVAAGGRVPVQLTATLKGLQREYASVKNIVRLVMEAGPVITGIINDVEESPPSSMLLKEGGGEARRLSVDADDVVMFKEKGESDLFESLIRQTHSRTEQYNYAMSTPAADGFSPFAAFRREVERRVMEQLALEKKPRADLGVEQEEGGNNHHHGVYDPIHQNLPLRGRLRESGAARDASEITACEPRAVDGTWDQSSLTDAQQQSTELEKLRDDLSALEQQLASAKEGSARADRAEAQLQQLAKTMAATVPLDIHEQVVKLERESLVMARKKIAQVTAELREKEVILGAVKHEMATEQDRLLKKVRMMSSELSKRASVEEVEAAVKSAVHELETELRKALQRAESMKLELETNETLLKQIQKEWDSERASLCGELANVKEQVTELQRKQAADRTKYVEAVEKVHELEDSVSRVEQSMVGAEEERINREKFVLATVKSLVADMAKTNRVRTAKSNAVEPSLLEASEEIDATDRGELTDSEANEQMSSAEYELEAMLPEEKAVALETHFHVMGGLIQQESARLETMNHRSRDSANLKPGLRKLESSKVDGDRKPIITLYYESSWEFAYLHYSVDSSGWTELPGVCMRNDIVASSMPLKVIDIEGSSIEFVLTDGRGSWDCAPIGGNYHIENSGTFLLSSGFIEQKQ